MSALVALALDVLMVLLFAAIGRASHADGLTPAGIAATASPFLLGTGVGWLVVRARGGGWPRGVGPGITVWFATVLVGMLLRVIVLRSFAWAFLAVAAATLALLLVGWRALATWWGTRSAGAGS